MGHYLKPTEPLYETVAVLSYEVGALLEAAMYLYWGGDSTDVKARKTLLGQAKSSLMDIGAQFQLLCDSLEVNPEEITRLGLEKAEERFSRKDYKHFNLDGSLEDYGKNTRV